MPATNQNDDAGFEQWYRASKSYRRMWVPHGIDQWAILRSLYRHRAYARGTLLDVGCGSKRFLDLYRDRVRAYWGIDLPSPELHRLKTVDVYADATQFPLRDSSITTVLSTQMLGFVYDHEAALREIQRVLEPGGCLILSYSQSGGQSGATDYFRFTPAYYRLALERTGLHLEVLEARTGTLGAIGEQLSSMIFYRGSAGRLRRFVCYCVQRMFMFGDRMFFDPHHSIGHTVIARKPYEEPGRK